MGWSGVLYTMSQKTSHRWLTIILTYYWYTQSDYDNFLAEVLPRKYEIRQCFVFLPHLSSASALPCEIGNPEDSPLVHFACNSPTSAALSTSFIFNHAPNSPHWLQGLVSHTAAWVWVMSEKNEEIKQLVEFRLCTSTAFEGKCNIRVSPFYQVMQKHKLSKVA